MNAIRLVDVLSFLASCGLQVVMASLLPLTRGYTSPLPTLGAIICINLAILLFARLVANGVQLSLLVPMASSVIPLLVILVAVVVFREPAPFLKIALLVTASIMIGVASALK